MRDSDEDILQSPHQEIARTDLVVRIAVGMQEQDRDRLDLLALEPLRYGFEFIFIEILKHAPCCVDALVNFDPQCTLDQWPVLAEEQIVRFRAVHSTDLIDVAEPTCGNEGGVRTLALEQCVDGHRCAMQEQPRRSELGTGLADRGTHALDEV